jgi:hypothetical protein
MAWTPWQAWGMDLLKNGIAFTVGAFVTVFILNRLEDRRAANRFVSEAAFQLRVSALDDFRRFTLRYCRAAFAAYTDLYQWITVADRTKTDTMRRYEEETFEDFTVAVEAVRVRFADVPRCTELLEQLEFANRQRHGIYDVIVDAKLDGRIVPPSRPAADRAAFKKALDEVMGIREQVLQLLEDEAEQRIPKRRAG